jgi:hypothetical protein
VGRDQRHRRAGAGADPAGGGILDSERNRPGGARAQADPGPAGAALLEAAGQLVATGMEPSQVAGEVVAAVRSGRFYVLTHPELNEGIRRRVDDVLSGGPPTPRYA